MTKKKRPSKAILIAAADWHEEESWQLFRWVADHQSNTHDEGMKFALDYRRTQGLMHRQFAKHIRAAAKGGRP